MIRSEVTSYYLAIWPMEYWSQYLKFSCHTGNKQTKKKPHTQTQTLSTHTHRGKTKLKTTEPNKTANNNANNKKSTKNIYTINNVKTKQEGNYKKNAFFEQVHMKCLLGKPLVSCQESAYKEENKGKEKAWRHTTVQSHEHHHKEQGSDARSS